MSKTRMTRAELAEFIRNGSDDRTITSYLEKGILPKPIVNEEEQYWLKEDILKILGIDYIPDEPFMTPPEAAAYINVKPLELARITKDKKIPHYRLFNGKGVRTLYLKSELKAFMEFKVEGNNEWVNNEYRIRFLSKMFSVLLEKKQLDDLSWEIMKGMLIDRKTPKELADSLKMNPQRIHSLFGKAERKLVDAFKTFNEEPELKYNANLIKEKVKLEAQLSNLKSKLKILSKIELLYSKQEFTEAHIDGVDVAIDDLDFSGRALNFMRSQGIGTILQLAGYKKSHIKKFRNIGAGTINEMSAALKELGLTWKPEKLK